MEVCSIGFTKKTAEQFFTLLKRAGIRRLLDVRLNNVSQLAGFTKREDLQFFLKEICGADYRHEPLLAPTQEMLDEYKKNKGSWLDYETKFLALWRFMRLLYLDKKDRVQAWFTPRHTAAFACLSLLVLLAPVWRETVEGRMVLEPMQRAVVRVEVPGTVMQTNVEEGQNVSAGTPLLRLRNLGMESEAAVVAADLRLASARAFQAQMRYKDFATAERHREELTAHDRALQEKMTQLTVLSPVAGTVV